MKLEKALKLQKQELSGFLMTPLSPPPPSRVQRSQHRTQSNLKYPELAISRSEHVVWQQSINQGGITEGSDKSSSIPTEIVLE